MELNKMKKLIDSKHKFRDEKISEKILRNVLDKHKKLVKNQLEQLDHNVLVIFVIGIKRII